MRDIAESELQDLFKVHNLNGGNSQRESSPFYVSAINKDKSSSEKTLMFGVLVMWKSKQEPLLPPAVCSGILFQDSRGYEIPNDLDS